jgi:ribosomal protein S18 acetylase RimI-like enzyme
MDVELRRLTPDDWRLWREVRLEALRESPGAFSSKLSDWQGTGDTEERWRSRLVGVSLNLVAFVDAKPAGVIGARCLDDGTVEVLSTWVAPWARGHGVGDALVDAVLRWAKRHAAVKAALDVYRTNQNAIRLYQRHGFVEAGAGAQESDEQRMECSLETPDPRLT